MTKDIGEAISVVIGMSIAYVIGWFHHKWGVWVIGAEESEKKKGVNKR